MQKSESIAKLAEALAKAQAVLKNPPKSEHADIPGREGKRGYAYDYVSLDVILDAIRAAFAPVGLSLMQWPTNGKSGPSIGSLLMHSSGEWIYPDPLELPVGRPDAQGYGSAITYARRYVAQALAGITGEKDDDAHAAMPSGKKARVDQPTVYDRILKAEITMLGKKLCSEGELRRHLEDVFAGAIEGDMLDWPQAVYPMVRTAVKEFIDARQPAKRVEQPKVA